MNLQENISRLKMLMDLKEQISNDEILNQIENGDFSNLKQYLSINSTLRDNLYNLLKVNNLDDVTEKIMNSNKTLILKGMQIANQNKDLQTYVFLDKLLKKTNKLS
jgi:hypothetical protein